MRNLTILSILLAGMLAATVATATEQRANALMYNLALEDDTDIFLFPHLADQHTGLYFDAPQSYTDVSGGGVFQIKGVHGGVFLNRHTIRAMDRYRMQVLDNSTRLQERFQDLEAAPPMEVSSSTSPQANP